MNDHPKWNFQEFSAFLMLYAASADLKVTSDEKEAILQKVNEESYEKIWKEYHSISDINKINLIISYKGLYFPTSDRTNELLDLMKKEFMADGEFSLLEKNLMRILKKLI
ncbi:MAG: hypothetical protein P8M17_12780 [Saprospiraceae bacterium]|nr:hypothetical protein [bacterium]MDG1432956.1 hypothetical protein [Saprospiraceae bacterium]MDG2419862.1 hypothetical protein [Saprospiraceae bacterium]